MKKHNFILLEILIACLLLSICAFYLIEKPIELYQSQIKRLENIEKERLANLAFAHIKELLLKNKVAWSRLPKVKKETLELPLSSTYLQVPYCSLKPIQQKAILTCKQSKAGVQGETYLLLDVEIWFGDSPLPKTRKKKELSQRFIYNLFVEKRV